MLRSFASGFCQFTLESWCDRSALYMYYTQTTFMFTIHSIYSPILGIYANQLCYLENVNPLFSYIFPAEHMDDL